jgi:hypothetical protein
MPPEQKEFVAPHAREAADRYEIEIGAAQGGSRSASERG